MTCAHADFAHDACFYGSEDEFLELAVPFLDAGVAASEPTLVSVAREHERPVLEALDEAAAVTVVDGLDRYEHPLETLLEYRRLLKRYVDEGADHVRVVGQVPYPALADNWESWARYEAAINHVHASFPVSALCFYDTREAPSSVLADIERTHPHVRTADGHRCASTRYTHPDVFLTERARAEVDPLEQGAPHLVQLDPSPAAARREVASLGAATRLDPADVDGLLLAVSETVLNALAHGQPPVVLRAWSAPDRVLVTVQDRGSGPDPYAGLLPGEDAGSRQHGLWMAHRMCTRLSLVTAPDGCTVRLLAGTPVQA